MIVRIRGDIRRLRKARFGPIVRERWITERFDWQFVRSGVTMKSDGFAVTRIDSDDTIRMEAQVRSVTCYIGDFPLDGSKTKETFSFVSVAHIQISGTAYIESSK